LNCCPLVFLSFPPLPTSLPSLSFRPPTVSRTRCTPHPVPLARSLDHSSHQMFFRFRAYTIPQASGSLPLVQKKAPTICFRSLAKRIEIAFRLQLRMHVIHGTVSFPSQLNSRLPTWSRLGLLGLGSAPQSWRAKRRLGGYDQSRVDY
jgi:hypothetical protein